MDTAFNKTKQRLDDWCSGEGIDFVNDKAKEAYKRRTKRVANAVLLEANDRIPVTPMMEFFYAKYAGVSPYDVMYNAEIASWATKKTILELGPDAYEPPLFFNTGHLFEALDIKQLKWPGHGVPYSNAFQYVEEEYMKEDEYELLINDPSDYVLRKYLPRVCGNLSGLQHLAPIRNAFAYYTMFTTFAGFATPEGRAALEALIEISEASLSYGEFAGSFGMEMNKLGYSSIFGAFSLAPFDAIADTLRGTHGAMIDMYRQPDILKEACDRFVPNLVDMAVSSAEMTKQPIVFIPLHKGTATSDDGKGGFMSIDQFNEFYWPSLRKLVDGLVDHGLVPNLFAEGNYTSRLDIIKDVPKGKCIYHFEEVDLQKAKDTIGDIACIRGSVPIQLMCFGGEDEVKDYCKKLIDIYGQGGGFIMDVANASEDVKIENMRAVIEYTKEYGAYDKR